MLKICSVEALATLYGSEFQMEEAAAGKARLPTVHSLTDGTAQCSGRVSRRNSRVQEVALTNVTTYFSIRRFANMPDNWQQHIIISQSHLMIFQYNGPDRVPWQQLFKSLT